MTALGIGGEEHGELPASDHGICGKWNATLVRAEGAPPPSIRRSVNAAADAGMPRRLFQHAASPCYADGMVIPALRSILDEIETWPEDRQEQAAAMLGDLAGANDDLVVPDEEVAEIERMLAKGELDTVSLEEFRTIFADYLK